MATKDKKSLEQQIRDLEAQIEKLTSQSEIQWPSKDLGDRLEAKIFGWVRNDEFFSGLRNTYARVIITLLSVAVLFGYGYYAFMNSELSLWYLGFICLTLVLHAISVRFVFNLEDKKSALSWPRVRFLSLQEEKPAKILDEYHLRRRDKALQRAHESFVGTLGLALVAAFLYGYKDYFFGAKDFSITSMPDAVYNFTLSGGQILVIAFFVSGWVSLQKYWSYGVKGEPFVSRSEAKKLRDS
jgi:hypothetical protein